MTKFLNISTDNTLGGNSPSDETVSSQKALKTYIDAHSSGSPSWGNITGTLSNQTDLQSALNAKYDASNPNGYQTSSDVATAISGKQNTLVSGTNIKTVNGNSLLGSGDVNIATQATWGNVAGTLSNQTDLQDALDAKANDSDVVKLTGNQTISGTKTFSSSPVLPTPATSDNSTKGATTAYVVNVLKAIYPVGSCYIGTTSTCPLSAFFGTWTLVSSGVVTAVNSKVPVKGTGMTMGLQTSNNRHFGLVGYGGNNIGALVRLWTDGDMYGTNIGTSATDSESTTNAHISHGLTTDATKSGIVGTVSSTTLSVNIWERTA